MRSSSVNMRVFKTLFLRDLVQELRTRNMLISMGLYAVLILIVYGATIAGSITASDLLDVAPGLFWTMLVFSAMLGVARTFQAEGHADALSALLVAPIERHLIFFSKMLSNFCFLLIVTIVCLPLFWFLFLAGVELGTQWYFLGLPLVLGAIGMSGVGTLLATLTMRASNKDVLLAVLFIPIMYPLLYATVTATNIALCSFVGLNDTFWMCCALSAGYDIVMLVLAWILYGFIIEA